MDRNAMRGPSQVDSVVVSYTLERVATVGGFASRPHHGVHRQENAIDSYSPLRVWQSRLGFRKYRLPMFSPYSMEDKSGEPSEVDNRERFPGLTKGAL